MQRLPTNAQRLRSAIQVRLRPLLCAQLTVPSYSRRSTTASAPRQIHVAPSTVNSPAPSQPTSPKRPLGSHSTPSTLPPLPEDTQPRSSTSSAHASPRSTSGVSPPSPNTPTSAAIAKPKPLFYPSASVSLSPTSAGAGTTMSYHLITPQLALLALLPTAVYENRRGLVEYNVVFFREGVQEICEVEADARKVK